MKLNKEQYRAAKHVGGPMLVLAGPGSGKTHLLVERIRMMIEESGIQPENILVITFSKKAARQMQARFAGRVKDKSYPVTFGTFHAVFYHILKEHNSDTYNLITEEQQHMFIREAVKVGSLSSDLFADPEYTDSIISMIGAYKNFGNDFYERNECAARMTEKERSEFSTLLQAYDEICRKESVLDFDDMIVMCRKLLYEHEMVLRKWQNIYRYILVDEFQDINDAQYDVLRLLASDSMNVFAVGDDDQSIYAFRGARPELMKKFLHQYAGCRQVTLTMNYRCCENVIGAADTLIRHNMQRLERPMQRHLPSNTQGSVYIVHSENTDIQAAYVCDMIEQLTHENGYDADDIAVLYRTHHCVRMFEKTAEERGIRLRAAGDEGKVSRQDMIHEAYIRACENRATRADIFLIMNTPPRGLSREALCNSTGDYFNEFRSYYADDPEMLQKVDEFEAAVISYDPSSGTKTDQLSKKNAVNIMTAHASKGLEYKCVFVIGLQEGLFPHHKNMSGIAVEEERRLMYVAMTRAKERLYMCCLGTEHGKRRSRFIGEVMEKKRYIRDCLDLYRI